MTRGAACASKIEPTLVDPVKLNLRTFPESIIAPIAMHVEAKRYLAANEPGYFEALSYGSQRSLEVQGGPFTPSECAEFLRLEGSADAVDLRRWDDHGKVTDLEVRNFDSWIPLLREVANG